jgi:DNA repair exonuclease SbcCD nuclease subunit
MRFMHIADIHLGYQQYGLKERFDDFSKTFLYLVDQAVDREVDFVLLAGDLFEKRTVEPLAMRVAIAGLEQLQEAGIPVLAVEGNHEKAFYRDQTSWMDFLDALGYLKLLNPRFEKGRAILEPYGSGGGAYVDLPEGVRIYGLRYYGASTGKAIQALAETLSEQDHSGVRYAVVMMHAGLEGQIDHVRGVAYNDISRLQPYADYLALGHIHKPYVVDNWIYNPGSPETCGMEEVAWHERGCLLVELKPGGNRSHEARFIVPKRRPFHRFYIEVDALMEPAAVYDAVDALIRREGYTVSRDPRPVIQLSLVGLLPFSRYDLDLDYIQRQIEEAWDPLTTRVRNLTTPAEFEIRLEEETSRPEVERTVVRELLERDARYREQSEAWAEGTLALKRLVLERAAPEAVIDLLRQLRLEVQTKPDPARAEEAEA